ncbi:hypothetical protein FACS189485_12730 [Spirochaetia bacterium]|nr:hypothetical protein FACS189485_12730 [Spirochaetia bacterium]
MPPFLFWHWPVLQWTFTGLSLACFLTGVLFLPNIAQLTHPKLDAVSVALVGLALVGILYGVSTVFTENIIFAVIGIVIGIVFLVLFVKRQNKLECPLIDLKPLAGRIYDKHGARILLPLGFALIAIFAVALSLFIGSGFVWLLAVLYIPVIGGSALIICPVQSLALSHLAPEQNPHGVTILSTGFQIAGCFGASLFTGLYFKVMTSYAVSGASMNEAGSAGFLAAGILTAVFALIGLVLAVRIGRYSKA